MASRVRIQCTHCEELLDVDAPHVSVTMLTSELAAFGKAIIEARLLHCIFDCKALQ